MCVRCVPITADECSALLVESGVGFYALVAGEQAK
jgi:hypothetical protein